MGQSSEKNKLLILTKVIRLIVIPIETDSHHLILSRNLVLESFKRI